MALSVTWQQQHQPHLPLQGLVPTDDRERMDGSSFRNSPNNNNDNDFSFSQHLNPNSSQHPGNVPTHAMNQAAQTWTPSPNAAPFYPQYNPFFNHPHPHHQVPIPVGLPAPQQQQFFDQNQQFAWAYQQMMLQQAAMQQQQIQAMAAGNMIPGQNGMMPPINRVRTNSGTQQQHPMSSGDFFQNGAMAPGFGPPHPGFSGAPPSFRHSPSSSGSQAGTGDWSRMAPYARPDAAGSSNSVNSTSGSGRQRTNSNQSASQNQGGAPRRGATVPSLGPNDWHPHNRHNNSRPSPGPVPHQRTISNASDRTQGSSHGTKKFIPPSTLLGNLNGPTPPPPSSSSSSSNNSPPPTPTQSPTAASVTPKPRPVKPSPLSQQSTYADSPSTTPLSPTSAEIRSKRLSKDDSELLPATSAVHASRSTGLKGRFKRALAFTPPGALEEHQGEEKGKGRGTEEGSASQSTGVPEGSATPKPKSRLFSGKFNASTDNISLSSTVSSASVMIRRLGSIGKLARRNSLMSIGSMFKDKNKDKGEGPSKKSRKSDKADVSVSHVTVELDRGTTGEDSSLNGLSPAAMLARQHTLKSNAEIAARKLKEQQVVASSPTVAENGVPSPWEKNTTTRQGSNSRIRIREDGTWDDSDNGSGEGGYDPQVEETVKQETPEEPEEVEDEEDEDEPWAIGLRRSFEKSRKPGKSVIKNHVGYVQENHLDPPNLPFAARVRSNSYNTSTETTPGPLARIPSPDPDHIDGLHDGVHKSTNNTPETKTFTLPPFTFESEGDAAKSSAPESETLSDILPGGIANSSDKPPTFAYAHPTLNSSAPALSAGTMTNSATVNAGLAGMGKKITFAATLSIYDTFSATTYDRRSEPSTANRLTPALAQRIKEELNSYKMEEMDVHTASRVHTHFFV